MCKLFQHMFPNNVLCIKAMSHLTQNDLFHDRGASGIGPTFKDGDQKWVRRATIQVLYRSEFSAPEACFFFEIWGSGRLYAVHTGCIICPKWTWSCQVGADT